MAETKDNCDHQRERVSEGTSATSSTRGRQWERHTNRPGGVREKRADSVIGLGSNIPSNSSMAERCAGEKQQSAEKFSPGRERSSQGDEREKCSAKRVKN